MDIGQYESSADGKLVCIKRIRTGYLAPTEGGIIKFNRQAEVTELGVSHNSTLRLSDPIAFTFVSTDAYQVVRVIKSRAKIIEGSLTVRYKIITDSDTMLADVRFDANENSEVVITAHVRAMTAETITGGVAMRFNIMDDFVEVYNSTDLRLSVLEEGETDMKLVINGISNIKSFVISSTLVGDSDEPECVVTSGDIISDKFYQPMIFKFGISQKDNHGKVL